MKIPAFNHGLPARITSMSLGHGSFINIDLVSRFGKRESIWIYLCDWTFFGYKPGSNAKKLFSSDDAHDVIASKIVNNKPHSLNRINIRDDYTSALFIFPGYVLRIQADIETYGGREDLFRLYSNNNIISINPEERLKIQKTTIKVEKSRSIER